ncbi:hypothetical protein KLA_04866 [Cellulophaga geojensis KL-A]|uniref:OmdA domain containing protein n=1 Tax=Cellulophaga geojensis KL-A TaxID=1328323 RepID=A0ABN0RR75_9FLAO|nr:YdeI/OmpD-associated family protein [Cellulophaga geojensis]EWH14324.1 hypothetical protein KLA_04866 [Cellulophaga geojensis KL-A]
MANTEEFYFKTTTEWRAWLLENHNTNTGIHLILYKVDHKKQSMRWEDAVKVALCFGWIDSTVKSLGEGKRRQYFCPRKPKSVWSKVNKTHINTLIASNLMHKSGLESIEIAKENGSWNSLDDVENGVIPTNLQEAFDKNPNAFNNYNSFAPSYKKGYLYYLNQAKREETKQKRIAEIIKLCDANIKSRNTW